ncbi:MAG: DUF4143 domain-containing protein [Fibrobacteraceae bacterium]|nr:DUF4143 domain-containing protein [Fibrobacteraceae bacterium]
MLADRKKKIPNNRTFDALWANKGALAEQMVGMLFKAGATPYSQDLFYWQQMGSSNAKIDYLVQDNTTIVPIEVKAGKRGPMNLPPFR